MAAQLSIQQINMEPDRGGKGPESIFLLEGPGSKFIGGRYVAVGQSEWYHFRVGELAYFSGWIGMFTRGTIWILTHGHVDPPAKTLAFCRLNRDMRKLPTVKV